jgi:hypothetical protein
MAHVHLVLDVEVGGGQEGKQVGDIGRNLVPEVRLDQGVDVEAWDGGGHGNGIGGEGIAGERGLGRGSQGLGRAQEDLSPEPFPTQSSRSWAWWATVHVGRLHT